MITIKQIVCEEEFNRTYKEYYPAIYKYCLARLNCDYDYCDDCVQETFIALYRKMLTGEVIENTRAFLYATATNYIKKKYSEITKRNNSIANIDDYEYLTGVDTSESIVSKINYSEFEEKLNKILNEDEKELYQHRFVNELQVKEIALKLGITPANCSIRITRLRRKIISELKEFM